MPKTLNILRHAKSDWGTPHLSDIERELNKRGHRDAPRMGAALAKFLAPQPCFVSPARRAQLTLEGAITGWPELAEQPHSTEDDLYTFSSNGLLGWLKQQDDDCGQLFILGHNPGMTDLVNYLCGRHELANLPTAGFVQLGLAIDNWRDLEGGCGNIKHLLRPKAL